ncbi:MAG: hypothetical protein KGZ40_00995 [Clostridiales bacterium]|nr:hypothetical protein [Clostridiales bacterium]
MAAASHTTPWLRRIAVVLAAVALLASVTTGCRPPAVEVVNVEASEEQGGRNLAPLREQVLADAKLAVEAWLSGDEEQLGAVFTQNMIHEWARARGLDENEGVERVRVHSQQEFTVSDLKEDRPRVSYKFLDDSYFVDADTGDSVSEPYGLERELVIVLVLDGESYKIDTIIGSADALR